MLEGNVGKFELGKTFLTQNPEGMMKKENRIPICKNFKLLLRKKVYPILSQKANDKLGENIYNTYYERLISLICKSL